MSTSRELVKKIMAYIYMYVCIFTTIKSVQLQHSKGNQKQKEKITHRMGENTCK